MRQLSDLPYLNQPHLVNSTQLNFVTLSIDDTEKPCLFLFLNGSYFKLLQEKGKKQMKNQKNTKDEFAGAIDTNAQKL